MHDDVGREFAGLAWTWQERGDPWTLSAGAVGYKSISGDPGKIKLMVTAACPIGERWTVGGVLRAVKKEGVSGVLELGAEIGYRMEVEQPVQFKLQYVFNVEGGRHLYMLASSSF